MFDNGESNDVPHGHASVNHATPASRRIEVIFAGALGSGITAIFLSKDWCFVAFSAGLAGAMIAWVADRFVWPRLLAKLMPLKVRLPVAAMAGCVVGLFFQLNQGRVFERAFGMRPPEGITSLRIERHYGGGPGDEAILMEFVASQEALETIVAQGPFDRPGELVELYSHDWEGIWRETVGNFDVYASGVWRNVQPMSNPVKYRWSASKVLEGTTLIWDAESGRAYALFTRG